MISSSRKAKLVWQCRRGMLELDLLLSNVIVHQLGTMTEQQIASLECLLTQTDPDIYAWLMGYEIPKDKELLEIVAFIRSAHRA